MTITPTELTIRRLTGNIGAEIDRVHVSADLSEETIGQIRAAILAHKVVFFRGQHHLDDAGQVAFAGRLGTVTQGHPVVAKDSEIFDLDYSRAIARANIWHTDVTFLVQPPSFSVLRSLVIPPVGGDTLWANTAVAYTALPTEVRELAEKLWALHTSEFDYAEFARRRGRTDAGFLKRYVSDSASTGFKTIHPVVTVHPETAERSLLLGSFARGFVGYNSGNFEALRRLFQDVITKPEHTIRWNWQVGDLVIWDNRSTQHYATSDYGKQPRHVRRVTVAGQIPLSVNGEPSRSVQGDCSAYNRQTPDTASAASLIV
jgi:alpha-ketoglutarate-dependent sulfate ester dioxygenase